MLAWLERMNFNEGGADCPPKEPGYVSRGDLSCHFNEGGADCPPKVRPRDLVCVCHVTSMKGGRTAPRKAGSLTMTLWCGHYFNEGGADCPPKASF